MFAYENSGRNREAVVGGLDVRADAALPAEAAKFFAKDRVGRKGVGKVGQPGVTGADASGQGERFVQGEVRVMGRVAHGIEGQVFQPLQFVQFALRKPVHVRKVGDVADTESQHRYGAVVSADRQHVGVVVDGLLRRIVGGSKASVGLPIEIAPVMDPFQFSAVAGGCYAEGAFVDPMDMPFRCAGIFLLGKSIGIFSLQGFQHRFFTINLDGVPVGIVECADVIQAARMVFVVVGEQNGVQMPDIVCQHLGAKIRPGIDQDAKPVALDQGRRTEAFVLRIGRAADRTATADDGHPLRSPGTEECQRCHRTISSVRLIQAGSKGFSTRI